jgi:hypothetical protein
MRSFILVILQIVFLITISAQSDTSFRVNIDGIEKTVSEIKKNEASYKKSEKYRDSLGARYAFTRDGELMFTRAQISEPVVNKKVEWYFDHGQIIFCEQTWTVISSGQIFNHERLYLKNGKLLLWLNTEKKEVDPKSNAFKETEFYLVDYSKTLLKEAKEN